ncbi:MAG: glycosyltransferase [Candidatus Kerfeldbacteria bacterium]
MNKIIFVFSMFTYNEYQQGITNTNSHVFNWLKNRSDVDKIYFIDFNRVGFIGKLKYFIKAKLSSQLNMLTISYQVNKIDNKLFHYAGVSYSGINKIIHKINQNEIELWSFNPLDISFLDVKKGLKVFYTIDDWRKNISFKPYTNKLESNYNLINAKVNHIFVNNIKLKENIFNNSKKVHLIPNGVDINHYKSCKETKAEIINKIDNKIQKTNKPIIGYMGVINPDRIDFELVKQCLIDNPDKEFVFAGPVWGGFKSESLINEYSNIKFIGPVYYEELPYLFSQYDVCLIPHYTNEFIQSMNPKKMYEYLASGKPVVTTPVSGTDIFSKVLYISNSNKDFSNKISEALDENNEEQVSIRQKSVIPHDWNERFKMINKIINQ